MYIDRQGFFCKSFGVRQILNSRRMVQNNICLQCNVIKDYTHIFIEWSTVDTKPL